MVELCQDKSGINQFMVTNGYLLTPDLAYELKKNLGLKEYQITLDGPPEVHDKRRIKNDGSGTFERILSNIKGILNHDDLKDIVIIIRVNIDNSNRKDFPALLDIIEKEGIKEKIYVYPGHVKSENTTTTCVVHNCLNKREFAEVESEMFRELLKRGFKSLRIPRPRNTCAAVSPHTMVIGPEGEIYKCWMSVGKKEDLIGHLEDNGQCKVENIALYLKWVNFDVLAREKCRNCKILPLCMGGCIYPEIKGEKSRECDSLKFNLEEMIKLVPLFKSVDKKFG